MSKRIETVEGFFGEKIHYENGKKVGESWPGILGGSYNHYDADGNKTGESQVGVFTEYEHYNGDGEHVGYSQRSFFGDIDHYDDNGYTGHTGPTLFGEYTDLE